MVSLNQFSYQPFSFILYELPDVSIEIQNLHSEILQTTYTKMKYYPE